MLKDMTIPLMKMGTNWSSGRHHPAAPRGKGGAGGVGEQQQVVLGSSSRWCEGAAAAAAAGGGGVFFGIYKCVGRSIRCGTYGSSIKQRNAAHPARNRSRNRHQCRVILDTSDTLGIAIAHRHLIVCSAPHVDTRAHIFKTAVGTAGLVSSK